MAARIGAAVAAGQTARPARDRCPPPDWRLASVTVPPRPFRRRPLVRSPLLCAVNRRLRIGRLPLRREVRRGAIRGLALDGLVRRGLVERLTLIRLIQRHPLLRLPLINLVGVRTLDGLALQPGVLDRFIAVHPVEALTLDALLRVELGDALPLQPLLLQPTPLVEGLKPLLLVVTRSSSSRRAASWRRSSARGIPAVNIQSVRIGLESCCIIWVRGCWVWAEAIPALAIAIAAPIAADTRSLRPVSGR